MHVKYWKFLVNIGSRKYRKVQLILVHIVRLRAPLCLKTRRFTLFQQNSIWCKEEFGRFLVKYLAAPKMLYLKRILYQLSWIWSFPELLDPFLADIPLRFKCCTCFANTWIVKKIETKSMLTENGWNKISFVSCSCI